MTIPLLIGSFNYPKAQPGSKHHIAGLDTELQVDVTECIQTSMPSLSPH